MGFRRRKGASRTCKWWSGRMVFLTRATTPPLLLLSRSILSVGFISSDIEFVIHCQVGFLDGSYINAVLFLEVLKLCFLLTNPFSIPVC